VSIEASWHTDWPDSQENAIQTSDPITPAMDEEALAALSDRGTPVLPSRSVRGAPFKRTSGLSGAGKGHSAKRL
jgi:hypothetical protein